VSANPIQLPTGLQLVTYVTEVRGSNSLDCVRERPAREKLRENRAKHTATEAAIRHLPERRELIEALFRRDPEFRSLCEDLGDAEAALARWALSTSAMRVERLVEYEALVAGLMSELRAFLEKVAIRPVFRSSGNDPSG
jgi:hypothetical protein